MSNDQQLRIVTQAAGMYCLIHSLFAALQAMARLLTLRLGVQSVPRGEVLEPYIIEELVYAAMLLVPAWILLAKTDWCARAVADLSRPRDETEPDEA